MLGFYCINKPSGENSTEVVSIVKRITGQKCGHLGTLDPLASGVLPVAVGKATKLFDWFLNKDKHYYAIGKFGVLTDTLDSEGTTEKKENENIKKTQIEVVLPQFLGKISQIPPKYSSININGVRAYDLAREGKNVELPTRQIQIYSLSVEEVDKNLFAFYIHCSAGTYVRSLILDIAKKLGTVATTVCIIRTASGNFTIENSNTIEELKLGKANLLSVDKVVDLPKLDIDKVNCQKLLNGQTIKLTAASGEYLAYSKNKLLGIISINNLLAKIKINLWENYND